MIGPSSKECVNIRLKNIASQAYYDARKSQLANYTSCIDTIHVVHDIIHKNDVEGRIVFAEYSLHFIDSKQAVLRFTYGIFCGSNSCSKDLSNCIFANSLLSGDKSGEVSIAGEKEGLYGVDASRESGLLTTGTDSTNKLAMSGDPKGSKSCNEVLIGEKRFDWYFGSFSENVLIIYDRNAKVIVAPCEIPPDWIEMSPPCSTIIF